MPIEPLCELADQRLPCWIDDPVAVEKLRLPRAAELIAMIVANAPESAISRASSPLAHVLAITQNGRHVASASSPVSLDALLAEQPSRKLGK
ncbi:MAG: hypothetical protein ABI212_01690 [Burkholderiaceae bacterium]